MKKLLFIIALSLLTAGTYATEKTDTKDDTKKVSYAALRQFEETFPSAKNISWKINDLYVKAAFTQDGKPMAALYDLQGSFIGAVEYIPYQQIPEKARITIEKRFKDFTFSSALKIVSRPSDDTDYNDVGTYWLDLTSDLKQICVNVSTSNIVSLHKSTTLQTNASK